MKVGYWTLLVAAVTVMAGPAWGQPLIDCFVMSPTDLEAGGALTLTGYDAEGAQIDLAEWTGGFESNFLDSEGERIWGFFVAGADVEEDGTVIFEPFTQEMLDCEGPSAEWDFFVFVDGGAYQWFTVVGGDAASDSVADLIAAGGNCEAAAPEVSARITGPHNVDVGADVTLTVVTDGIDSPTYLWDDASTAATLALGVVDAGDTGVYTCTVGGEAGGEAIDPIEASFTLWVGVATPLAGGLGLGLLAGACALAGAVSIRRKK